MLGMGAKGIAVDDFAQAIKDVLEGNQTAISHQEAREIVNKYFEELETKMNAASSEGMKSFHFEPSGISCKASTHPGITWFTPNTAGCPRLIELSNRVPSIRVPS